MEKSDLEVRVGRLAYLKILLQHTRKMQEKYADRTTHVNFQSFILGCSDVIAEEILLRDEIAVLEGKCWYETPAPRTLLRTVRNILSSAWKEVRIRTLTRQILRRLSLVA